MTNAAQHHKVIILGSGPSGLTAAIYTARANLSPLLIHGPLPGGQLTTTTEVENFPGFPEGIMGPDLMQTMEKQAARFGTTIVVDTVIEANIKSRPFTLKTNSATYTCDALIISTGATPKYLGLENERKMMGYGVSTCATCDGAFFRNKIIAVNGGGDSACEEANFLTRFGSKVYLIHRRGELRASKIMRDRVMQNPKIEILWNKQIVDIAGSREAGVTSLKLKDTQSGEVSDFAADALFVAIGHSPNSSLFKGQLKMDENGYIVPKPNSTATDVEGVFASGDVQDHVFRQAITAAGTGCMAAIEAERWLESRNQ
ncbi:MAG: thioredoxin-disulfide reductase [Deltaproteobacteria bacterium]|nr:thioredoxin-disulfide reductase [Deltaproteobacteria bacterium]